MQRQADRPPKEAPAAEGAELAKEDRSGDGQRLFSRAPLLAQGAPTAEPPGEVAADRSSPLEEPDDGSMGMPKTVRGLDRQHRRSSAPVDGCPAWCPIREVRRGMRKLSFAPNDLWVVLSIKFAECTGYYGLAYIYVEYLSVDFGFNDWEAGNIYAVYGALCTIIGVLLGFLIDRLGLRRAMLVGTICSTLARGITAFTRSPFWITFACLTFGPMGAAFGVPVLALGVRRYTHVDNRAFGFSFFYAALCLACVFGSVIINRVRTAFPEGALFAGHPVTWVRVVAIWCAVVTAYTVIAAWHIRDIKVDSSRPLEDQVFRATLARREVKFREAWREAASQPRFWRVTALTLVFCGTRMTFRHMDATLPKYFIRAYGPQAPFEIIVAVEPVLTMIFSPIMTGLLLKYGITFDRALLIGSFISGISVFALCVEESYAAALSFIVVLAVGESIWSPKLYEFSTMSAPDGREGMYVAIATAPMYFASVPTGWISGWLLEAFYAEDAPAALRHGQMMWFFIGVLSFVFTILLFFLRHRLFRPEDNELMGERERRSGDTSDSGASQDPVEEGEDGVLLDSGGDRNVFAGHDVIQ